VIQRKFITFIIEVKSRVTSCKILRDTLFSNPVTVFRSFYVRWFSKIRV